MFDLFLASDCLDDMGVCFEPDEDADFIASRKLRSLPVFVIEDATGEIVRDTAIERAISAAGEQINIENVFHRCFGSTRIEKAVIFAKAKMQEQMRNLSS
jgi:hypothetical protein